MYKILTFLLVLVVAAFAGPQKSSDKTIEKKEVKATEHAMIKVPTVQCSNCVKTITTATEKVEGVESIDINVDKKMAHVSYNPDEVKIEDIRAAIANSGYDADDVKRDEKAHAALAQCCQLERK